MQRDRRSAVLSRIAIEDILCVLLLAFFAMRGAIPGIAPNQANEMTNTAATGVMKVGGIGSQFLVNGLICALAALNFRRLWRFSFALQWAAALVVLAICSTAWSQDAMTTARRSIPFALATLFALYIASRFQVRRQLMLLVFTMALLAVTSAVLALFAPSIGLEASTGHFGNWQGVFTQKNACGRAMVFATGALLSLRGSLVARLGCFLMFLFVLAMSGSRGAWMIEAILLVCFALLKVLERFRPSSRTWLLSGSIAMTAAAAVTAFLYLPWITEFLGRDSTLSGRTAIWREAWTAVVKHPMLGYGFAAFWEGMKGESYNVILALRFVVFHAHNGFLEIWLELGAVGLTLFCLSYLRAWRRLWTILRSEKIGGAYWMVFVLLLVVVYDLDENTLLAFNGLFWVLYVVAIADIEILAVEMSQRRPRISEVERVPAHAIA